MISLGHLAKRLIFNIMKPWRESDGFEWLYDAEGPTWERFSYIIAM
jgi:hypothetical protein